MLGVILPSMVVMRADRRGRTKRVQPGNWEWATVTQGVNANGWCIRPFIILQGAYHLGELVLREQPPARMAD